MGEVPCPFITTSCSTWRKEHKSVGGEEMENQTTHFRQEIVNEMPPRSGGCEYSHLYCTSFAVVGREQVQMTGFNGSNRGSAARSPQSLAFPRRNASDLVDDDGDWAPDLTSALSRTWKSVRWVDESSCSRGHCLAPGFYRAARV